MKTKVLVVGTKEMIQTVHHLADQYPEFSFVPLMTDQNMKQKLERVHQEKFDCVFVIHPCMEGPEIVKVLEDFPVYEINYSMTVLYKTLFNSVIHSSQGEGSMKISLDIVDKSMLDNSSAPLYIKEHHPDESLQDLIDFHIHSLSLHNVTTVVTSHPGVFEALHDAPVKVELLQPTETCIREFLTNLSKTRKPSVDFPIRYESDQAIEHFKKQGISGTTIYKLQHLCQSIGRNKITAAELAKGFSITLRSARRILTTLENQKIAKVVGEEQVSGRGRPRYVYCIDLNRMNEEATPVPVMN